MASPPPTSNPTNHPITLRLPSKYSSPTTSPSPGSTTGTSPGPGPGPFTPPPLSFLHRTWTVTHSTLSMWRAARNVRITYGPLPSSSWSSSSGHHHMPPRMSDLVEYESLSSSKSNSSVKRVSGVDTASGSGSGSDNTGEWDWRGSGLLFFVRSHWEVLGWGERMVLGDEGEGGQEQVERWVVTWFAPTIFTAEGIDVYSDRREGGSEALVREVMEELKRVVQGSGKLAEMVEKEMREVAVSLPWREK
ncbi:hypothetical protein N656DRAFT_792387 [Canariomyces notabilis]|uniref:Uncharacterized protein n=1 Tax=Canariomyces notabilis TaxID=2074819 RepID=A0AAN6QH70_9PEZI|nr:hypothetical protein N656DRAFT_792387 [Canariomyces arenarius]